MVDEVYLLGVLFIKLVTKTVTNIVLNRLITHYSVEVNQIFHYVAGMALTVNAVDKLWRLEKKVDVVKLEQH